MAETRMALTRLRAWRLYHGLSQGELAQRAAGVGVNTVSRLETGVGRANFQTLAKLAQGLGISREQLLHEDPPGEDATQEGAALSNSSLPRARAEVGRIEAALACEQQLS